MRIPSPGGSLVRLLCFFGDDGSYPAYRELACAAWPVLNSIKDELLESPAGRRLRELLDHVLTDEVVTADPENYAPGCWALAVLGLLEGEDRGAGTLLERWANNPADRLDAGDAARRGVIIGGPSPHQLMPIPPDEAGTERDLLQRYGTIRFVTINDMFTSSAMAIEAFSRLVDDGPATPRPGASAAGRGTGGTDPGPAPGHLGLELDDANSRVTRAGHEEAQVEFHGRGRAWSLFVKLFNNGNSITSIEEIREIWKGDDSITDDPHPTTIQVEISKLRQLLKKQLGVDVKNTRKKGYRLIELVPEPRRRGRPKGSPRKTQGKP
jgi:hypothetical protein